ncbi:uncharacterized protein N0V89_003329 [Didymosphaeria variabile]|uniref:Uncharacterized protein n=1 Tax=Didymosphaeria variabile TaxID=1932322 RepID=A0A9W9CFA4_9PLEO|nr:uncharacterized protein N0V89_003329 [Didymosphaeria variabile]KAJ4358745.1 hypothetical protein N0V89_003329 [Didymosphaeria variabile]
MAAFSRGVTSFLHPHAFRLPSTLRATLLNTRLQATRALPPTRQFSASILRRYAAPSRSSYVQADPVLRSVIQTHQPVLLYKEPPRNNYLMKVYAWATVTTGIGLYNFYWVSVLPEGLSFFVAPTYIVIGIAFCAIGIHIYQRPVRRLATLEVVPGYRGGRLQLRLTGRKEPWAKDQVIETDIFNATISEKTGPMLAEIVEANRARQQSITQGLEHLSIPLKVWEIMARWVEQKWTSFFLRFKFAVLQFGIIHVEVDGVKWKIDCTGYLREQGAAVDRILPVE